jgi:hypothetical protein
MVNKKFYFAALAGLTLVCLTGCGTMTRAPVAQETGFPVIDIVDASFDIANDSIFAEKTAEEWKRSADTKIIGGILGTAINPKDLTINLVDTSIQIPIKNGADLSDWFLNCPQGLKATAHAADIKAEYAAQKGATSVIVTFTGIPEEVINQPIRIRIPYTVTNRSWDFLIPANPDRRFEVYGVAIADIVVGGAVNSAINEKLFTLKFGGTKLASMMPKDQDVTSWFTNIPNGLNAYIAEDAAPVNEGQQTLTITIKGTPTTQTKEKIRVSVPPDITTANMTLELQPADAAVYDIGSFSTIAAKDIEIQTGSSWRGAKADWALEGPSVFSKKDFTAVGIIQLQVVTVYAMGEDGEYHWTGDTINYANLMAEAKKLNAHAIIDVVLDYKDVIDETVVRRHVEAGHIPTRIERSKRQAKLLEVYDDPNGGDIYEETIRVTRRTWTGTALAIQYAAAAAPVIGNGNAAQSYVPSQPYAEQPSN